MWSLLMGFFQSPSISQSEFRLYNVTTLDLLWSSNLSSRQVLSIHQLMNIWVVLTIVNISAMTIFVQAFMWIWIFISPSYPLRIDSADTKISFLSIAKIWVFITSTLGFCPSFSRKMNKDFPFLHITSLQIFHHCLHVLLQLLQIDSLLSF